MLNSRVLISARELFLSPRIPHAWADQPSKYSFNGAPMHSKVQGTALIAYLPGQFIQITGVEGRTYLVREGRLGEVVAIDAGKMLLVKPTAKRLPDTVDVNLSDFVKNSPMFNGGLKLAASELIARAIEKQSKNRYLKPTPIYLEGAGTEAVIAEGNSVKRVNRSTAP